MSVRNLFRLVFVLLLLSIGGCPPEGSNPDNMNDPNQSMDDSDGDDGDDMGDDGDDGDDGEDGDDGNNNDGDDDDGNASGALMIRNLGFNETSGLLELIGTFGDTPGTVFVNGTARAVGASDWSNASIRVPINPLDTGEVYVNVEGKTSNSRWITAWDFSVTRRQPIRLLSVCGDCYWEITWSFRFRGDTQPVDYGAGPVPSSPGGAAVKGAMLTVDSVTGTYELSGETITFAKEDSSPVYHLDGQGSFVLGGGEWYSATVGVRPTDGEVLLSLHVDTDAVRVTNLDSGNTYVEHVNFFGVFASPDHIHTLVIPISPSLNIPEGSTSADANGGSWEWRAAPVKSPPPGD